jgi:hypothetical protein
MRKVTAKGVSADPQTRGDALLSGGLLHEIDFRIAWSPDQRGERARLAIARGESIPTHVRFGQFREAWLSLAWEPAARMCDCRPRERARSMLSLAPCLSTTRRKS